MNQIKILDPLWASFGPKYNLIPKEDRSSEFSAYVGAAIGQSFSQAPVQQSITELHKYWWDNVYRNYQEPAVRAAHVALSHLLKRRPIAFYGLSLCRNADQTQNDELSSFIRCRGHNK